MNIKSHPFLRDIIVHDDENYSMLSLNIQVRNSMYLSNTETKILGKDARTMQAIGNGAEETFLI